ncbi:deoxyribodipyrimidine photo-lyase [Hyphomicrobium sp.]|uniref:cryptochrome/photolyase family protein n=1 Tax=Hyphomicrobium sp. TaxID=82 RepID=UPI002E2F1D8C|nr:deoxyribodipyrimidine photo-lyase [Hyphomicrobium sp.]HEX2843519.1 deoxyribodipyrimidine photo-lyase [Hyphomicrobium sp.]
MRAEPLVTNKPILVWFRRDLRIADHAALSAAVETGLPIVAAFVLDDQVAGPWRAGAASRWWLHHSIEALARDLAERGCPLVLRRGDTVDAIAGLVEETGAEAVYCSRAYEPWAAQLEHKMRDRLQRDGIELRRFAGALLHDPDRLKTQAGGPFKVYTPFWRAFRAQLDVGRPLKAPDDLRGPKKPPKSELLDAWALLPWKPDWASGIREIWTPGEDGARGRLKDFLTDGLGDYAKQRNRPDMEGTSRLSPHLAFGEISPRQCWYAAEAASARQAHSDAGCETYLKELAWREFSSHLLHHWPDLPEAPFRPEFKAFPWRRTTKALKAWQKGLTGYPIVDAGMRELWHTGWMHNRVRMIVASFLIKDLLLDWREGEAWFWDTLVDADLANNSASWQWVAGSGADAAPYFRIFNPVTQGETFDPDGVYVRRWVPELGKLSNTAIHAPWQAPAEALREANVVIGETYPAPIVDHSEARRAALAAFDGLKSGS